MPQEINSPANTVKKNNQSGSQPQAYFKTNGIIKVFDKIGGIGANHTAIFVRIVEADVTV